MAKLSIKKLFELDELSKTYEGRKILNIQHWDVSSGELFAIVGPSGAGKSTLLRLLDFIETPTSGSLKYQGNTHSLPFSIEMRRKIGMVFQRSELLAATVWDNVNYPLRLRGIRDDARVDAVLDELDLTPLARKHVRKISGGESQRVALARVLVSRPEVLLLDEPTANLDPYNVELIEKITRQLNMAGTTVVMVTHNVYQARRLADRIGLLLNGKFVEIAKTERFFSNPDDPRVSAFVQGKMVY